MFSREYGSTQGGFGRTAFMVQAAEQLCEGRRFLYKEENFLTEAISATLILFCSGETGVFWRCQHLF